MKRRMVVKRHMYAGLWVGALAWLAAGAGSTPPLRLRAAIPLPAVQGRIDHFDADVAGHRVFMSALGNNTVEVFDTAAGKLTATLRGVREPQGVAYAPRSHRLFVASAADGTCRVFDGRTLRLLKTIPFSSDADDTRYDAASNRVFVGYGEAGDAGLAILDGSTGALVAKIALPDHPESFQLDPGGARVYVNIPDAGNIVAVVDRERRRIAATWRLEGAQDNFPMALDAADHRLFVICRNPAEMLALDTASGRIVARVPCAGDADDVWYDAARRRIYVTGGSGFLSVIQQSGADRYSRLAQIATRPGARTSLFVPQWRELFLGLRREGGHPAELRVYAVQP